MVKTTPAYAVVMAVVGFALFLDGMSTASAAVLCQQQSGILVVRATVCGQNETGVDLAQFGAVTTIDPSLPSGATQVGMFSGGLTFDEPIQSGIAAEITIPVGCGSFAQTPPI